jgi:hypothetical protein
MAAIKSGNVRNGKIHPDRVRSLSLTSNEGRRGRAESLRAASPTRLRLAKRVHDLAHQERTSEQAIVDCALWLFFEKGQDANVMSLMSLAGIAPRRRRA